MSCAENSSAQAKTRKRRLFQINHLNFIYKCLSVRKMSFVGGVLGLMRESISNGKQVCRQTQKPIRYGFSVAGPIGMFRMCNAWLLLHYVCQQQFLLCHLHGLTFFMRIKLLIYSFDVY